MLTKEAYNLIKMIIANKYEQISRFLNERTTRLWVATESQAYGYGGIKLVYEATGIAASTIRRGIKELESYPSNSDVNQKPRRKQRGILRAKTFTGQSFVASYGEFTLRD